MYNKVDRIICLAKYTKNLLVNEYQIPKEKIALIYNGLENEARVFSPKEQLKEQLFIPQQTKILLFVGRLDPIKGVDVLIHAFKRIVKEDPDWHLIIVGDGDYSTYLNECNKFWEKITFTGRIEQEELYKFYQIADVGVMPSTHEQCSYVAIEMMMFGLPMILSTSTGLSEMLAGENRQYRVPAKEIEDKVSISSLTLKNKIRKAFSDKEYKIGIRKQYEKKYTLKIMRKKYLEVYTK